MSWRKDIGNNWCWQLKRVCTYVWYLFVLSAWMLTSHTFQYCINCDLFIIIVIIIIMSISIVNSQYSYIVLGLFYNQSKQILNWQCVVGFEVLTAMAMKSTVFQVITACSSVGVHGCFVAIFRIEILAKQEAGGKYLFLAYCWILEIRMGFWK